MRSDFVLNFVTRTMSQILEPIVLVGILIGIIWNNLNPNGQKVHKNILSGSLSLEAFPWLQVAIHVKNKLEIETQLCVISVTQKFI